jgi:hypothetical protein
MRVLDITLAAVALVLGTPGLGSASPIAPGAFGATVTVESFEGLTPGANLELGLGLSLLEPGTVSAFDFGSGVRLTSPIPNPGFANGGAFIHDFALGTDVQNNWGGTRVINDAGDVPFGSAYLGAFHPSGGSVSIAFEFDVLQQRVGAYVTGLTGSNVQLSVYDASGTLLESLTLGTVDLALWPANFLGLEQLGGIRTAVFTGEDFGLDGLSFESGLVLVPEPDTLSALALGLAGLMGIARLGSRPRALKLLSRPEPHSSASLELLQS